MLKASTVNTKIKQEKSTQFPSYWVKKKNGIKKKSNDPNMVKRREKETE